MTTASTLAAREVPRRGDLRLLACLWPALRPHARRLWVAVAVMPLVVAVELAQPWLLMLAIDEHVAVGRLEGLAWVACAYVGIVLLQGLAGYAQVWAMATAGQRFVRDLRVGLYARVLAQGPAFVERRELGRLVSRVVDDAESLGRVFSVEVVGLVVDVVKLVAVVAMMLALDVELALWALLVLPVVLGLTRWAGGVVRRASRASAEALAELQAHVLELLGGRRVVRAFGGRSHALAEHAARGERLRAAHGRAIAASAVLCGGVEALCVIAIALLVARAAGSVAAGAVSVGLVVALVEYVRKLFGPLREASSKTAAIQAALAAAERVVEVLELPEQGAMAPSDRPRHLVAVQGAAPEGAPAVELRGVCFAYRDGTPVLRGLDLRVERGEHVALVGASGAGKSTIVRLIAGLHRPTAGSVCVLGRDADRVPPARLRERVAWVGQDAFLFAGTVADNVRVGRLDATDAEVAAALAAVGADRLLAASGRGPGSPVLERGSNLSLGERQLVVFARALVRDPELLVLDEATAQVDPATEALVEVGLHALLGGRACLVVAHRTTTVQRADRIVVIEDGRAIETGPHAELLRRGGCYARLHARRSRATTGPHREE